MSRTVYVNGNFMAEEDAKISVFDRGFLFADGVYEVTTVLGGNLIDNGSHLGRLERSLSELAMALPLPLIDIEAQQKALVERNALSEGIVYLQVTRGAADRDFPYPKEARPSLIMFTQEKSILKNATAERGISIKTIPDIRWKRRDIKSVGLLPAAMAKQAALNAGADDAWMVEEGFVTEASSANAYIVTEHGVVITRHLGNEILPGTTRRALLRLQDAEQIAHEERPFTPQEAYGAAEAFITSASAFVMPVVSIDGYTLGDGTPGPITKKLRQLYIEAAVSGDL